MTEITERVLRNRLLDTKRPQQNQLIAQLKNEIRAVESQIEELASMLTEVKIGAR